MIASSVASDLRMREAATGIKPSLDVVEIVTLSYHEMGSKMTAEDLIRANSDLQDAALTIARFMQDFDVLLSPTRPPKRSLRRVDRGSV
jgi:amidase